MESTLLWRASSIPESIHMSWEHVTSTIVEKHHHRATGLADCH